MTTPAVRQRPHPPDFVQSKQIRILHPGYDPSPTILLLHVQVTKANADHNDLEDFAFPRIIAEHACNILADNKPGKLFTKAGSGVSYTEVSASVILPGVRYYFCLDGGPFSFKYSLCLDFDSWAPPIELPEPWLHDHRNTSDHDMDLNAIGRSAGAASVAVRMEDEKCLMTGTKERLEAAYLVPKSSATWFTNHTLNLLAGDEFSYDVNTTNNRMTLHQETRENLK
ncbi:hypothetical protein C8R45DRAFT_949133 [Mycena sanguinolenta]|nr:hypothetical protein C8R45DRAFT_949133 [Mycena sanguinolenta]